MYKRRVLARRLGFLKRMGRDSNPWWTFAHSGFQDSAKAKPPSPEPIHPARFFSPSFWLSARGGTSGSASLATALAASLSVVFA